MKRMSARWHVDDEAIAVLESNLFSKAWMSCSSIMYQAAKRCTPLYSSRLAVGYLWALHPDYSASSISAAMFPIDSTEKRA